MVERQKLRERGWIQLRVVHYAKAKFGGGDREAAPISDDLVPLVLRASNRYKWFAVSAIKSCTISKTNWTNEQSTERIYIYARPDNPIRFTKLI